MVANPQTMRRSGRCVLSLILVASAVFLGAFSLLTSAQTDWSTCLDQCSAAVVLIEAPVDEEMYSYGSGALISPDGYVLTAQHVIEDALSINVYVPGTGANSGSFAKYEATVVESSADADVAVLKIDARELPALALGDSDTLQLEQEIRLLGYPQQAAGVGLIIGRGVFLGTRTALDVEDVKLIQIDVSPFDHGHSGGPVISAAGEIVGVAVHTWTGLEEGAETHKLAVSINSAKRFIPSSIGGLGTALPSGPVRGPAPTTWEIFGFSTEHLYIIPGDPAVGYPTPMPRRLPVEWAGDLIVGPDGQFYCSDVADQKIVRLDPHTRKSTLIFESGSLYPADLAFDEAGNLLFSTYDRNAANSGDSMGIWKIPGAEPGAEAERLIEGSLIKPCGVSQSGCTMGPPHVCAIVAGPYRGDLLVSGRGSVPIARAIGPDFQRLVPFIQDPGFLFPTDADPLPSIFSDVQQIPATGNVMVADFIWNRILEFDWEGNFIRVLTDVYRANRLTWDYAGNVYVSGSAWGRRNLQHIAGFSPDGTRLFELPMADVMGAVILEK